MVNLGEIKTAVYARGFEDDQAARIVTLANDVQRGLLNSNRWRFAIVSTTVAAVAGTAVYTLPTSPALLGLESIRLAVPGQPYNELLSVDSDTMLELTAYGTDPSYGGTSLLDVQAWTELSPTQFQVYPAPTLAGTFTVRYLRTAADLAVDADIPLIPAPFLDIIVAGVCKHLAIRENQDARATRFENEYNERLHQMTARYAIKQRQSSVRVEQSGQRRYDNTRG